MADSSGSNSTKVGAAAGGGGLLVGLAATFGVHSMLFLAIVIGGILIVAALVLGYLLAMRVLDKKRAAAGDEAIEDDSRRRLQKVNDPEQVAKIAELGRQFEEGAKKYRQATGQRLSEASWYVFTGTPGSGKTEAIRHCGIQMPEGLHKEQQGAGGTVNMDWWFTEEGIILDTAGRYLSDHSSSGEWERFLKLLNKARPGCPINGMLIALPADSLQKDTTEEVQQKATEIARFLERARSALGVRFPVFVIITKSDLIPGFREFFAHINDPEVQAQIVGWSKPGGLDEPFEPDDVEEYLKTLRNTLLKRRVNLLSDPTCTEDPDGRRLNEVDSLYLFPDSLMEIAPRLKRYLQMVFVKSKFNQTPLFLRGIYFTSAFEEGAALDSTLARIRGVSLEELEAEGRTWKRERALFLRELFEKKVFKENGLVTRASNTQSLQRNRKLLLLGSGFAALLVLGCFTWFSYRTLAADIGPESDFAVSAAKDGNYKKIVLFDGNRYVGDDKIQIGDLSFKPISFYANLKPSDDADPKLKPLKLTDPIPIPTLFKPLKVTTTFNPLRQTTFRLMFDENVLNALVKQSLDKFRSDPSSSSPAYWAPDSSATLALAELLKLECIGANGTTPQGTLVQGLQLQPLFKFLPSTSSMSEADVKKLQATLDTIYDSAGKPRFGDSATLPERCFAKMPDAPDVLNRRVADCVTQLQIQWFARYAAAENMVECMDGVRTTIVNLDRVDTACTTLDQYDSVRQHLRTQLTNLQTAVANLPNPEKLPGWHPGDHLADVLQANHDAKLAASKATWKVLHDAIFDPSVAPLAKAVAELEKAESNPPEVPSRRFKSLLTSAQAVDGNINYTVVLPRAGDPVPETVPVYLAIAAALKDATDALPELKEVPLPEWRGISNMFDQHLDNLDKALPPPPSELRTAVSKLKLLSPMVVQPALKYTQIRQRIDNVPSTDGQIAQQISTNFKPVSALVLFMVPAHPISQEYTRDGALKILNDIISIHQLIDGTPDPLDKANLVGEVATRENAFKTYLTGYRKYWATQIENQFSVPEFKTWKDFCNGVIADPPSSAAINETLRTLRLAEQDALRLKAGLAEADRKSVPATLVPSLDEMYTVADTACRELNVLQDSPEHHEIYKGFNDECYQTLNKWIALAGDSVPVARAKIMALPGADFRAQYIAHTASDTIGSKYYKNLYDRALSVLADEFEASAGNARQSYTDKYDKSFPLSLWNDDDQKCLTDDDAKEALKELNSILSSRDDAAASDSPDEIGKALGRIYKLNELSDDVRKKYERQRKLLTVLTDPKARFTLTFISRTNSVYRSNADLQIACPHADAESNYVTAIADKPDLDVKNNTTWAGYRCNSRDGDDDQSKGDQKKERHHLVSLVSTSAIWLKFSSTDTDFAQKQLVKQTAVSGYSAPSWAVMKLLQEQYVYCKPGTKDKGLTWFVEVAEPDKPNRRVLVQIEFTPGDDAIEMPAEPWWK